MKLTGSKTSFELKIVGYQFPDIHKGTYDSNWLVIKVNVIHATVGSWSFQDPCMLTFEVAELVDWLEKCSQNSIPSNLIFFEPNIRFYLINKNTLRVYFYAEALPPLVPLESTGEQDFYCDFPISEAILVEASKQLREQLMKFPRRGHLNLILYDQK